MGLPVDKLVIATNENDILHRFWETGRYETKPGASGSVQETYNPAMDILVSSNFERLLLFLAYEHAATIVAGEGNDESKRRKYAGQEVCTWLQDLKLKGRLGPVPKEVLDSARGYFESERISDLQTIETI